MTGSLFDGLDDQLPPDDEKVEWESKMAKEMRDLRRPVDMPTSQVGQAHPETAKEAARKALGRSGSDRVRVMDLVRARGEHGVTDDEIELALDLPHQTASARRRGLELDGWLRNSGTKRPTRSRTPAIVWVEVLP